MPLNERTSLLGMSALASDNEVEFEVLQAIADIHPTEFVRRLFMVELVAGPL